MKIQVTIYRIFSYLERKTRFSVLYMADLSISVMCLQYCM